MVCHVSAGSWLLLLEAQPTSRRLRGTSRQPERRSLGGWRRGGYWHVGYVARTMGRSNTSAHLVFCRVVTAWVPSLGSNTQATFSPCFSFTAGSRTGSACRLVRWHNTGKSSTLYVVARPSGLKLPFFGSGITTQPRVHPGQPVPCLVTQNQSREATIHLAKHVAGWGLSSVGLERNFCKV